MPADIVKVAGTGSKPVWASEDDFNAHRSTITEMYRNNLTLPRIMETMETQHAFFATTKMYKTRFRRWGLWKHCSPTASRENDHSRAQDALVRRHRTRAPDEWREEELLYRVIQDYYDGAFSSGRWASDFGVQSLPASPVNQLAIQRTKRAIRLGDENYVRFRAASILIARPSRGNNSGKAGDFAQGVRLMRICFAELSRLLLAGSKSMESPITVIWLMYIMVLFRESPAKDFRPVEAQLLRHLRGLTSSEGTSRNGVKHPTADLWTALCSAGKGELGTRFASDRYYINTCAAIAIERFSHHVGKLHPWTVDLSGLAIGLVRPNGSGPAEDKSARFRNLLLDLEAETGGVHCRHHGCRAENPDMGMLEEGIALLEGVLDDPVKRPAVEEYPEGAFNMYSLLTRMNHELNRCDVAERYMRRGVELAMRTRERTGEDADLFEGLNGLEVVLRAQGKVAEADAMQEERKRLVSETLESVGEKEDSA
ncbi:Clr5 domain-containing protein [Podospora aff. communis PSN243]|uniref:Clr5 domain-containing protein n=1 Tax=Podospora aff. communis PSN243 TaxID=3040156 RepID=A0AAV9GQN4_9PEZI|nr:Clr5 domain-containing protein [Podospora aff. communis PSN243]